jgi:hypothetical protein
MLTGRRPFEGDSAAGVGQVDCAAAARLDDPTLDALNTSPTLAGLRVSSAGDIPAP